MNRTPPADVVRLLRSEVGFVCPVDSCFSPFLTWHHFDPPWREKHHHDPSCMIALCREHHDHAEGGAFTKQQLRELKLRGNTGKLASSKMNWMRNRLLLIVGGNFYYETYIVLEYREQKVIWFNRDGDGNLLLNLKMLSQSHEARAFMVDNQWFAVGNEKDIACPPFGRKIGMEYQNGDSLSIEFFEVESSADLVKRYQSSSIEKFSMLDFPVTAVEVNKKIGETTWGFSSRGSSLPGIFMQDCFFARVHCAVSIGN